MKHLKLFLLLHSEVNEQRLQTQLTSQSKVFLLLGNYPNLATGIIIFSLSQSTLEHTAFFFILSTLFCWMSLFHCSFVFRGLIVPGHILAHMSSDLFIFLTALLS